MEAVGIVGLGLIGGSMALDLKRRGFARKVLGVETDPVNATAALKMGLCDEVVALEECVRRSGLVVVAIPADATVRTLPRILDLMAECGTAPGDADGKIVIDTCSIKAQVVRSVHYHPLRGRFVATHPMAGT